MHLTQIEIERELSDAFPQGKRTEIAGNAHIYPSVLLGWFNPDDERKSPHYQVLVVQAELDERYPADGDRLWQAMCRLRETMKSGTSLDAGDLPQDLLSDIGGLAEAIREISSTIADGVVDEKESQRLINLMSQIKDNAAEGISRLVRHKATLRKQQGTPLRAA